MPLWSCTELREGDGLWHVNVSSHLVGGTVLADVLLDQIFPLPAAKIATLSCAN